MSARDFKKLYNPKTGRFMFQHWSGGQWFKELKDINPSLLKTGITGSGHQPPTTKNILNIPTVIEQPDAGEAILNSLKNNSKVKQRLSNLIQGSGLRVN